MTDFYAIDSNIISYLLNRRLDVQRFIRDLAKPVIIPSVAFYEVQRGLLAVNAVKKLQMFQRMWLKCDVGKMDFDVWNTAAEIYAYLARKGELLEDADIMIAAYCVVNNLPLITNNVKHMGRIPQLQVIQCPPNMEGEQ
ncbi:MAG: PIN domain-containing protein [Oscillospiraceae bacterium]|jgi:predicted nucleic acid-binding protein|nr:PIN domain-containing protein [Oscillospiraceae bacterium]